MGKIITPKTDLPEGPAPLTDKEFNDLAGGLQRLRTIASFQVQTKEHGAEASGLAEFISNTFLNHAEEFLGAWITVRQEYQPLLKAIAGVSHRVGGILRQTAAMAAKAQAAEQAAPAEPLTPTGPAEPDNVIQLKS